MIINLKGNQKPKKMIFITTSIICLLFMIACTSLSFAEDLTLSLSSTSGSPGQTVGLTLNLTYPGAATASAFQLDINYDPAVLENPTATIGAVLGIAAKEITTSQPSSGVFRIVAAGFNQTIIQSGDAATIGFHVKTTAAPGQTDLTLPDLDLAATEPDGQPLDPLGTDGLVNVVVGAPTLSEWGMIITITAMMITGLMILRKKRMA